MNEPIHKIGDVLQIRIDRIRVPCIVFEIRTDYMTGHPMLMRRTKYSTYLPMKDHLTARNHKIFSSGIFSYESWWTGVYYLMLIGDRKVWLYYEGNN